MCLVVPHICRNNRILVENAEDIPIRPAIPSLPKRICVIAPSCFKENYVEVRPKTIMASSGNIRATSECISTSGNDFASDHYGDIRHDGRLIEFFDEKELLSSESANVNAKLDDAGNKEHIKLLDSVDMGKNAKIEVTRLRIENAKRKFQVSMAGLSKELERMKAIDYSAV